MWDKKAKKIAIKAIGTVETNLRYDAINYNDPITIGVAQWYGTRARKLLGRFSSLDGIAPSLKADIDAHGETDRFWNTRYLTRGEGNTVVPLLNAHKDIQNEQFASDLDAYANTAKNVGLDPDKNTETFIMFCVAYHQSPQSALQVLSAVGNTATLDSYFRGCLNHGVIGRYPNRYKTAFEIIRTGNTDGVGDVANGVRTDDTPGNADNNSRITGDISHIYKSGDNLHIVTKNGTVIAYPTTVDYWTVGANNGGTIGAPEPDTPSPSPSPSPGDGNLDGVVKWMLDRINKFAYSQAPGRLDPDKNGYGDCSSTVWRAYHDVLGIDVGKSTYEQLTKGRVIVKGAGRMSQSDIDKLQPGDLVLMAWLNGVQHVEMIVKGAQHIGHGLARGTIVGNNIGTYVTQTQWWEVHRYA